MNNKNHKSNTNVCGNKNNHIRNYKILITTIMTIMIIITIIIIINNDSNLWDFQSDFQTTLQEDIRLIQNSKKTMTFTDKTSNMYWFTTGTQQVITERDYFEI